jgi:RNA polymerase sigma factor (sigma-70 family)
VSHRGAGGREASPSAGAAAEEQFERLERAMDRLPEAARQVLLLCRVVGLTTREIAGRIERSESAVRSRLRRAGLRLLAALEERG